MKKKYILLIFAIQTTLAYAGVETDDLITKELDAETSIMKSALEQKNAINEEYLKKINQVSRYHPLFIYARFKYDFHNAANLNAELFNKTKYLYKDTYLEEEFITIYIKEIIKKKKWSEFALANINFNAIKSHDTQCLYLKAKIHSTRNIEDFTEEKEIINNYECKYNIKFKKNKEEMLFELAINATGWNKTRYINRIYNKITQEKYKNYVKNYLRMYQNPQIMLDEIDKIKILAKADNKFKRVIKKAILAASKDFDLAEKIFTEYVKEKILDKKHIAKISNIMVDKHIEDNSNSKDANLEFYINPGLNERNIVYVARKMIKINNMKAVKAAIQSMSISQQKEDRWVYWLSRCLLEENKIHEADRLYNSISKKNSFYGFIAAQQIGKPFNLIKGADQVEQVDELIQLSKLSKYDIYLERIRILLKVKQNKIALKEWRYINSIKNKEILSYLYKKAIEEKWNLYANYTLKKLKDRAMIYKKPPQYIKNIINRNAKRFKVDPSDLKSIIKQESNFEYSVESFVGAQGLMQIMPETATYIANKLNIEIQSPDDVKNPETNIAIGSGYYRYLMDMHENNRILALASYNAGIRNTNKWTKNAIDLDVAAFIESMEFKETRNYIKNILTYSAVYKFMNEKKSQILSKQELLHKY